ncbi:putative trehalose-6-phosphate synthase 1 [Aphelenchoides fujianensis]|nr:putative trehalose-6-phosphate synthase 1 [Aphelenchoides fujianensis]
MFRQPSLSNTRSPVNLPLLPIEHENFRTRRRRPLEHDGRRGSRKSWTRRAPRPRSNTFGSTSGTQHPTPDSHHVPTAAANNQLLKPFNRLPRSESQRSMPSSGATSNAFTQENVRKSLQKTLKLVGSELDETLPTDQYIDQGLEIIVAHWRKRDSNSELTFQGILAILEYCLQHSFDSGEFFEKFVNALGYHTVQFWRAAVPYIFDSDMSHGTKYRDALLFCLTLYDVNTGKSRLKELYAAVPGIRKSLLGVHAKRFGEHPTDSLNGLNMKADTSDEDEEGSNRKNSRRKMSVDSGEDNPTIVADDATSFTAGGLANTHFQQRVINVSNAPPVSLKREKSGDWSIKQGSGGLVSCVDPVMSCNHENMWLANLGMNLDKKKLQSTEFLNHSDDVDHALADVLFHVIADDDVKEENETKEQSSVRQEMGLLGVLNNYNRGNYKLNPVIVQEQDYQVYYGGISNGLLWPALHNLPEYIATDYDDPAVLREHWSAYVRVNYQFAMDAVRNSRAQDFIWIHDYHLMLTGSIMQSLDQNLEVGFFLHIPFLPPDNFFTKYRIVAFPILRGLMRFTKVGFQTHRDRASFIDLIQKHLPTVRVTFDSKLDVHIATYQGWSCSLGVFPVSIKNEDFLKVAKAAETVKRGHDIRNAILGENPAPDARCEKYPERIGKDVLYQVAVTNRRSVDTYREYQDNATALAKEIQGLFKDEKNPQWTPLIFQTDGLQRSELVAHYLAMDIGVVTPRKDGMNLVAKEMMVCNPSAGLVLSTGAGSEIQFTMAGLHPDDGDCTYHRIDDLTDSDRYADVFYAAATEPEDQRATHGQRLHEFIMNNDIERWSAAFLDPSWSYQVIRQTSVKTLDDFYTLMMRSRDVRRQIVERVLKGIPIRSHFGISLDNAKESLVLACQPGSTSLHLRVGSELEDNKDQLARFDIKNEIDEFEKDLNFLKFIQSDDVYNVEQFINTLQEYHPLSADKFREEVMQLVDLFVDADHFNFFFTDRDGTLKSYSCSYPASVQPAYSGVIQAQFARRCAQTCAIVTTAPMMRIGVLDVSTIPEGFYYYGASAGREWFMGPTSKFKDQSIPEADLELLEKVFAAIGDLLEEPEFRHFTWVGSGLQKHYGHLTVAHQDAFGSVKEQYVKAIDDKIHEIIKTIDPSGACLSIKETETDLKIFLKSESGGIFDKGHGIRLLVEQAKCDLTKGTILVCGDSSTDLPMLEVCLEANPKGVFTVWVTTSDDLKETGPRDVRQVLLGGMAQATVREISISRPRVMHESE